MNYRLFRTIPNFVIFYAALLPCIFRVHAAQSAPPDPTSQKRIYSSIDKLPLSFEANAGQTDSNVRYLAHGKNYTLFLTGDEAVIALTKWKPSQDKPTKGRIMEDSATVRMRVAGANSNVAVSGLEPLPGVANYFHGNDPTRWQTGIATFAQVKYAQVYPGIDLIYYGREGHLEYDFAVAPGADPDKIRLKVDGAQKTSVDSVSGDLVLNTDAGEVRFRQPTVYQPGLRAKVDGRFTIDGGLVAFHVGQYDRTRSLIIDPQLAYSTYLGGSDEDTAYSIALNAAGDAFITGITCSVNFPVTSGAYQGHVDGPGRCSFFSNQSQDLFVSKLNSAGTALIYSTYIGGSNQDAPTQIAVDSAGNAYVAGLTFSQDYPTTTGALQTTCAPVYTYNGPNCGYTGVASTCAPSGPNTSGFVTKLNPTGTALAYSTFIGGTGSDSVTSLAIDSAGEAYVTGASTALYSANLCPGNPQVNITWPTTSNAYLNISNNFAPEESPFPVFSKFNADGSALSYSTAYTSLYNGYGGLTAARANQVAVDQSGKAHIAGSALYVTMPGTSSGYQPNNNAAGVGGANGWVAIFDPSQSGKASLVAATMLGGDGVAPAGQNGCYGGGDNAVSLAIDSSGNNYLTGTACSANFPTTAGAVIPTNQKNCPGNGETPYTGFAAKLNPTLSALTYSTFLGGTQCVDDYGAAVTVNANGLAFITGNTSDSTFPQFNALPGSSLNGTQAPFVTELNGMGTGYVFSSFLGSLTAGGLAGGSGIAVDAKGNIYVTGGISPNYQNLSEFPATPGAFQPAPGGLNDGFVTKIGPVKTYLTIKNTAPSSAATGTNLTYTITVANDGPDSAVGITLTDAIPAGTVFLQARSTDGNCTGPAVGKTGEVTCLTSSLAKDAGFEAHLTVRIVGKSGTTITDTATVNSETSNPNSANNSATATTTVD